MLTLYYLIIVAALCLMAISLFSAHRLNKVAPGGAIGKVVNTLKYFVILFTAGYLMTPFMPRLSLEVNLVLMSLVYLFGGAFVLTVLWIIRTLMEKVFQELGDRS